MEKNVNTAIYECQSLIDYLEKELIVVDSGFQGKLASEVDRIICREISELMEVEKALDRLKEG